MVQSASSISKGEMAMILDLLANNPPPSDILHDPFFLTVIASGIAILAAVFGSVISICYISRKSRKEVVYNIISDTPILSMEKVIGGQLEVHYNNKVVTDLRLIIAEVWNSGQTPIPPEEFKVPITISFADPVEILDTGIVKKEPDALQASMQNKTNNVILEPLLLNRNNRVRLKILASGTGKLEVSAGIVGVELADYSVLMKKRRRFYLAVAAILLVISFIVMLPNGIFIITSASSFKGPHPPYYYNFLSVGGFTLLFISTFFFLRYIINDKS